MSKSLSQTLRGTNYGTLPITAGGTGATSAAAALAALGAQATLSAATSSANGYLTSADWTTFNSKQATLSAADGTTNGYLTSADWTTFNNKQTALGTASASVNGILSSTDWSTFNGKQAALVSGTSIKTVNGTALLGSGDLVITSGASATKTIANKTAAYTVVAGDLGAIINCTSGTFTVSLTAAATLGSGFTCIIWNTSGTGTDTITIDPATTETIDGKSTLILKPGEGLAVVCDGTNWQTDDKKPMRVYAENVISSATRPSLTGIRSVAIGAGTTAFTDSMALGNSATASGDTSFAAGTSAIASGIVSLALGASATASGTNTTAIGRNSGNTASQAVTGAGAMALGGSYASGADSFAAGVMNNTNSYGTANVNNIAIGALAVASGGYSATAIGGYIIASGNASVAIGYYNQATGIKSCSIGGHGGVASGNYSVAIGAYAKAQQIGKFAFGAILYGNGQSGKIILSADTTTTTAVILTSDTAAASTTNQLIVATNQAMTFFGILIAKQSASNNMASYKVSGAISNNAGTMALADVTVEKIVDTIGLTTEPTFTADSTNKALAVTSGAKATTNIRWLMNIDSVEVTYA